MLSCILSSFLNFSMACMAVFDQKPVGHKEENKTFRPSRRLCLHVSGFVSAIDTPRKVRTLCNLRFNSPVFVGHLWTVCRHNSCCSWTALDSFQNFRVMPTCQFFLHSENLGQTNDEFPSMHLHCSAFAHTRFAPWHLWILRALSRSAANNYKWDWLRRQRRRI